MVNAIVPLQFYRQCALVPPLLVDGGIYRELGHGAGRSGVCVESKKSLSSPSVNTDYLNSGKCTFGHESLSFCV